MALITLDQIQPLPQANGYAVNGTVLRVWYDRSFLDSDGNFVEAGNGQQGFYIPVTCTVTASDVTVPSFDLWTTIDAQDANAESIRCYAQLFSNGSARAHVFSGASTPTGWTIFNPDPSTSWTFANLLILNQVGTLVNPPDNLYPTVQEMIDFQNSITYANASAVTKGITKLSVAPASSTNPIAIGANDKHQPTMTTPVYWAGQYTSFNAAVTAIGSALATLIVSDVMTATTVSIPSTLTLQFQGAGSLSITTGNTVTIAGPIVASPTKIFTNATAGQGTISFSGNKTITFVWPEYWGGGVGVAAATNAAAFNAASAALAIVGAGTIQFGSGTYDFNATWVIGTSAFTGISVKGTNGLTGTVLSWSGSTSGTAISVTRGRYNRFDDFSLISSVAKGTSIGMIFTGPAVSEQTPGPTLTNINIGSSGAGFNHGLQIGGPGSTSAGEITTIGGSYSFNNTGVYGTGNGNTLVIRSVNTSFGNNVKAGIWMDTGTGDWHISGGGFGANGTAGDATTGDILLSLGWQNTVHIQDCRFEVGNGTTDTFRGGIINLGTFGSVSIDNSEFGLSAVPTVPLLIGLGAWTLDSCSIGGDAEDGWVLFDADGNAAGSVTVRNTRIQNTNTRTVPGGGNNTVALGIQFDPTNGGSQGMKINGNGNFYTVSGAVTKFDDVEAIIGAVAAGATGAVFANRRVNLYGNVSTDIYDFGNQNATPSVKWADLFRTGNTAGTTYTNFLDGVEGQTIEIFVNDGNTIFKNNTTIVTRSAADITATNGFTYSFSFVNGKWRQCY